MLVLSVFFSEGCNQSSPAPVCVIFETLYRYINAGKSSSFFSWHQLSVCIIYAIVMSFLVLMPICCSLVHIKDGSEYLTRSQPRYIFLWWDLCDVVWFWVSFSFSSGILSFYFFFHLRMFYGVRFQYSQVFVSFLFSDRSDFSWFRCSIPSVMFRLRLFLISMKHFSMLKSIPISWLYILFAFIRISNSFF